MSASFTIKGQLRTIQVSGDDLELLKDASCPSWRALIEDPQQQPILLAPNEDEDVNIDSIQYILRNIGHEKRLERECKTPKERDMHRNINIKSLSQQCNALYHFKCNPSPFVGLWGRLEEPCEPIPRPPDVWSWRRRPPWNIPQEMWPYYGNAAYVLGKYEVFSDMLCSIVWDSPLNTFKTAVPGLRDMQEYRLKYMESLFRVMTRFIGALSNENHEISRKIQEKIAAAKNLDIYLVDSIQGTTIADPWERSRDHLVNRTIYGFALQVDLALLKDTYLRYTTEDRASPSFIPTIPSSASSSGPLANGDAASSRGSPKSFNRFHLTSAARRFKELFSTESQYIKEVRRMFACMDAQIKQDQHQLTQDLIAARKEAYPEVAPASSVAVHHLGGVNRPVAVHDDNASATRDASNGYHAPGSSNLPAQYGEGR